jgi:hypothetical protein
LLSLTARGAAESNSLSGNGIAQIPFFVKRSPAFSSLRGRRHQRHPLAAGGRVTPPAAWIAAQPGHNAAMFRASRTVPGHATRLIQLHYRVYRARFDSIRPPNGSQPQEGQNPPRGTFSTPKRTPHSAVEPNTAAEAELKADGLRQRPPRRNRPLHAWHPRSRVGRWQSTTYSSCIS